MPSRKHLVLRSAFWGASRSTHRGDAARYSVCPISWHASKSHSVGVMERMLCPKERSSRRFVACRNSQEISMVCQPH